MSLTRRDVAETSIRTIAAFLTSVAVVGGGIGFFVSMASDLEAQQDEVLALSAAVRQLQLDVSALVKMQNNYATKADIAEILEWVRGQQELKKGTAPSPVPDTDQPSENSTLQ